MSMTTRFAGYPSAVAYDQPDGTKPVQQLLWGSYVGDKGEKKGGYEIKDAHGKMDKVLDRSVAVFGAISVVTDGHKVVVAQKLERPRGKDKKWDIYRLEAKGNGPLRYLSKH